MENRVKSRPLQENPTRRILDAQIAAATERLRFYETHEDAYMSIEDHFREGEGDKELAQAFLNASVEITKKRLVKVKTFLSSGILEVSPEEKARGYTAFIERLEAQGLAQNPFRLRPTEEDPSSPVIFPELEAVFETLKGALLGSRLSMYAAAQELEGTRASVSLATASLEDPLALDGENASFPPEEIPAELPAGVADTTSIITLAPTPNIPDLVDLFRRTRKELIDLHVKIADEADLKFPQSKDSRRRWAQEQEAHPDVQKLREKERAIREQIKSLIEPTPEPVGEFATMAADIHRRIEEENARYEAQQVAEAKAKAEKERQALEAARGQKAAALEKAKADLAKISGPIRGFLSSIFNRGEKERLQAEVARLTTELGTAEKALAQTPAQPERTPGLLDWLRTSNAAKVAAVAVAGVLALGAGSYLKNSGSSDQSPDTTPAAAKADTPTPSEATLPAPAPESTPSEATLPAPAPEPTPSEATLPAPAPEPSVTASTTSVQNFTPSNTLWEHFKDQGLTGEALTKKTNAAVIAANLHLTDSQLHNAAALKSVTEKMAKWGGYEGILKGAKDAKNLQSFLNTVPADQKPLVEGMAASVLGPVAIELPAAPQKAAEQAQSATPMNPMDAPLPGLANQTTNATPAATTPAFQKATQRTLVDPLDAPEPSLPNRP